MEVSACVEELAEVFLNIAISIIVERCLLIVFQKYRFDWISGLKIQYYFLIDE